MITFRQMALEWFKCHCHEWGEAHQKHILESWQRWVFPRIGNVIADEIKPKHLFDTLHPIYSSRPSTVGKIASQLRRMFNEAMFRGHVESNPAIGLSELFPIKKGEGFAWLPLSAFPTFLDAIETHYSGGEQVKAAFYLILLTAVRKNEAVQARWGEFDFDEKLWTVPTSRMKSRDYYATPLSDKALALLLSWREKCPKTSSDWVFPVSNGEDKPIHHWLLLYMIYCAGYKGQTTVHGLRKTFSTHANESGLWRPDAIEEQLAHSVRGVRGDYNKAKYLAERKEMMEWWSKEIVS